LQAFAQKDARIRVVAGEGRGLPAALALGRTHCRGSLIARMDADDECLPQRLERSVAALEADHTLGAVGTQVEIVRGDRPVSPNMQVYASWLNAMTDPDLLFQERLVESPLCHPSTLIRAAALDQAGGWRDDACAEDYQLWLDLLRHGWRLRSVSPVLFRWTDRDERLTRTDPRYAPKAMAALKARYLRQAVLTSGRCCIWGAGETGLRLGRALMKEGVEVVSWLEVDPKKVGLRIDGAPVHSYAALARPQEHLVAAVGAKGARQEIRRHLQGLGWREGEHFTCAA